MYVFSAARTTHFWFLVSVLFTRSPAWLPMMRCLCVSACSCTASMVVLMMELARL